MAKEKKKKSPSAQKGQDKNNKEKKLEKPFWTGVISFGLVTLPVGLYPASRGRRLALKMVESDGTPLRRRYFCERERKILSADEIVRGYEIEDNRFITIKDDELESVVPEKSSEITLSQFVDASQIKPIYFERGYFLAPDTDTTKAYRLLAKSMEMKNRVGIATFVLRGKEHLVAIIADGGILRAETLRFVDEIRSADDIGLPEREKPQQKIVNKFKRSIEKLTDTVLDKNRLRDRDMIQLSTYIEHKLKNHQDVIHLSKEQADEERHEDNVIDMLEVLKSRLKGKAPARNQHQYEDQSDDTPLNELSKNELYKRAAYKNIPGRSQMTKEQLVQKLQQQ